MEKEQNKVYINGRYEIKFIGLIETWGKHRIEGEYDVISGGLLTICMTKS